MAGGVDGGIESETEGISGDGGSFDGLDPDSADLRGCAGLELLEGGASCFPLVRFAEAGEVLEE